MTNFKTNEDVGLQTAIFEVDATTTILGKAPQYVKNPDTGNWDSVTQNDPYWSIKKIIQSGSLTTVRWADGTHKYIKTFSDWASYSY